MLTIRDWEEKLDAFLTFNERDVLTHPGTLRADVAQKLVTVRMGLAKSHAERLFDFPT